MATIYWSRGGHQIQSGSIEFLPRIVRLWSEISSSLSRWQTLRVTCEIQELWAMFAIMSMEETEANGLKREKRKKQRWGGKLLVAFLSLALVSVALAFHELPQSSFDISYFGLGFCNLQAESKKYRGVWPQQPALWSTWWIFQIRHYSLQHFISSAS